MIRREKRYSGVERNLLGQILIAESGTDLADGLILLVIRLVARQQESTVSDSSTECKQQDHELDQIFGDKSWISRTVLKSVAASTTGFHPA
jgi:hypothetical protein